MCFLAAILSFLHKATPQRKIWMLLAIVSVILYYSEVEINRVTYHCENLWL